MGEELFPEFPGKEDGKEIIVDFDINDRYGEEYVPVQENVHPVFPPVPIHQQPYLTNRFCVEFPEEFEIESYLIQSVSSIGIKDKKWKKVTIKFIETIEQYPTSMKLMKLIEWTDNPLNDDKHLTVKIKFLDPVGVDLTSWVIDFKDFDINFSEMDYGSTKLMMHEIILQPIRCRIIN